NWLLKGEAQADGGPTSRPSALANQRRLKALLHLVDLETAEAESEEASVVERVRLTVQVLLKRMAAGHDATVHRIMCAALARGFDAAVRVGIAEPSDLLLVVAMELASHSVGTVAQACTNPDLARPIQALAQLMAPVIGETGVPDAADAQQEAALEGQLSEQETALASAHRIVRFSGELGSSGSYRGEALRRVVFRLGRALEATASARGLTELVESASGESPLSDVEQSVEALKTLALSAKRRVLDDDPAEISIVADVPAMSSLVERAVRSGVPANGNQLSSAVNELKAELPFALGMALDQVLLRVRTLPVTPPSDVYAIPLEKRRAPLPNWLLPRRT